MAAGENPYVPQSPVVQNLPHLAGGPGQVPSVQAAAFDRDAAGPQASRQRDRFTSRRERIVGVEEQDRVVRLNACETLEGLALVVVGLDKRVRHGSVDGDAEA